MNKPADKKPMSTQQARAEAERKQALRDRVLLWTTLGVCAIVLWIVIASSSPQKSLSCDGGGASLLEFGTCR